MLSVVDLLSFAPYSTKKKSQLVYDREQEALRQAFLQAAHHEDEAATSAGGDNSDGEGN
jgi:hypothetical protein